jgi:hypothetical protein
VNVCSKQSNTHTPSAVLASSQLIGICTMTLRTLEENNGRSPFLFLSLSIQIFTQHFS